MSEIAGAGPVRDEDAFDVEAVRAWLATQGVTLDGEIAVRRQMKQINSMFRGRLPDAMGPRAHRRIPS